MGNYLYLLQEQLPCYPNRFIYLKLYSWVFLILINFITFPISKILETHTYLLYQNFFLILQLINLIFCDFFFIYARQISLLPLRYQNFQCEYYYADIYLYFLGILKNKVSIIMLISLFYDYKFFSPNYIV